MNHQFLKLSGSLQHLAIGLVWGMLGLITSDSLGTHQPATAQTRIHNLPQNSSEKLTQRSSRQRRGVLVAEDPNAQINLRSEPSERSRVKGYGLVGDQVDILDETTRSDSTWYQVKFPGSGAVGWINGNFVKNLSQSPDQSTTLSQAGSERFTLAGRRPEEITRVAVSIDSRNTAEVSFRLGNRNLMKFGGQVVARDPYAIVIDVKNSGNADADGTIYIEYGVNNSINTLFSDGRLDGQDFSATFRGQSTSANQPEEAGQRLVGQNVDESISRLRRDGWQVIDSGRNVVKLDRGQSGMDIEFDPRTREITNVKMIDLEN
ncbi:MAG: SH3 domain-containing protein [Microcoleaceae cyanobacterium]